MHRITHRTAQTLKAAGFPQPPFQIGQIWYSENGGTYLITGISSDDGIPYAKRINAEHWSNPTAIFEWEGWSYAASATEILPEKYDLSREGKEWFCGLPHFWDNTFEGYDPKFVHDNPAESAAKAALFTLFFKK
jgi:hypothetical protein